MTTITTRAGKGSPLTNNEVDANFTGLNSDKVETSGDSMTGDLSFGDNNKVVLGAGSDLKLYHTGSHSYIDESGTGNLYIGSNNGGGVYIQGSGETLASFVDDGAVTLNFDNAPKVATTNTGIDVTGTLTADGATIDNGHIKLSAGYSLQWDDSHERIEQSNGKLEFFTNNSQQMTISGSSVGIGTDSPNVHGWTKALSVDGGTSSSSAVELNQNGTKVGALSLQGDQRLQVVNHTSNPITFHTNGIANERMRIDNSGRVAIGASSASNGKLTLEGVDGASSAGIYFNNTATNGKSYSLSSGNSGEFMLYDRTSSAYRLFVDSPGNVGIGGAPSSGYKLDVMNAGATSWRLRATDNSTVSQFFYSNGTTATQNIYFGDSGNTAAAGIRYLHSNDSMLFTGKGNGTTMATFDSSGNLSLTGTVTADGATIQGSSGSLTIDNQAGSPDQILMLLQADMGTNDRNFQIKSPTTDSNAAPFRFVTSNSFEFLVDAVSTLALADNKFVGIGDYDPIDRLTVSRLGSTWTGVAPNANTTALFHSGTTNATSGSAITIAANASSASSIYFSSSTDNDVGLINYSHTDNSMQFRANNSERMRISAAGLVGISTTEFTDSYKMIIEGSDQETADLTDAGTHGATLFLRAHGENTGSGGAVAFGTAFGNKRPFAAIKGYILDGTANTAGSLSFSTRSDTSATALTERMRLHNDGRLSIGTFAPQAKLDVKSDGQYTPAAYFRNDGTATGWARADWYNDQASGSGIVYRDQAGTFTFRNDNSSGTAMSTRIVAGGSTAGNIVFSKDATIGGEVARFDTSGNFLVGTTDSNVTNNNGDATQAGINIGVAGIKGLIAAARYQGAPLGLNRLNNDGDIISLTKDGTIVGSIGTNGGSLYISSTYGTDSGLKFASSIVAPSTNTGANRDAAIDLGYSSSRFKDLYLSNAAYLDKVIGHDDTNTYISFIGSDVTQFVQGGAESMRIHASGKLLVGTTSADGQISVGNVNATTQTLLTLKDSGGTGTHTQIQFSNTNGAVGSINTAGSTTTYNTSSDQRLKENIADADDAGSKVDAIQVRKFDWKADGSHQDYGMIAQELQTVAPEAVTKGETEEDMMGVDYSKLVPMLVKEIQSLRARVAQLEND